MEMQIEFELPIYYTIVKKTKKNTTHLVGLNWFRNLYHYTKNKVKQDYHKLVADATVNMEPIKGQYKTKYVLYYKSKVCDGPNIVPMIEKFALDGLIEAGMIEEDNVQYNVGSDGWYAIQDKENPRLKIIITKI
jgi:hypothetical protein